MASIFRKEDRDRQTKPDQKEPQKHAFLAGILRHLWPRHSSETALQDPNPEQETTGENDEQNGSELDCEGVYGEKMLTSVSPAKSLPHGWAWEEWDDGSGHLKSPVGKHCFFYDRAPYANEGGIEYQETSNSTWDVFWGTMSGFKKHAEGVVKEKYLDDKAISHNESKQASVSDREALAEQTCRSVKPPKVDSTPKPPFMLGEYNISAIMAKVADNAWYGRKPTKISLMAGHNIIEIDGYVYEPGYEFFSTAASISLNGKMLYGIDSQNVGPYRNETYHIGLYKTPEEAISCIKAAVQNQEFILSDDTNALSDLIRSAAASTTASQLPTQERTKKPEPEM